MAEKEKVIKVFELSSGRLKNEITIPLIINFGLVEFMGESQEIKLPLVETMGKIIGITVFPDDCSDAESMLRQADIAMYQAKKNGRNCWSFYESDAESKSK